MPDKHDLSKAIKKVRPSTDSGNKQKETKDTRKVRTSTAEKGTPENFGSSDVKGPPPKSLR